MTERDSTTHLHLRPVEAADEAVLFLIYAGTRSAEMELVDWSAAQKEMFLRQQFHAQQTHYRSYYPDGSHNMIELEGRPVGRMYINRSATNLHLLDIALLPEYRGRRIGTTLMRQLLAEADAAALPITLHVYRFDTVVLEWYQRLGFTVTGGSELYYLMERTPQFQAKE